MHDGSGSKATLTVCPYMCPPASNARYPPGPFSAGPTRSTAHPAGRPELPPAWTRPCPCSARRPAWRGALREAAVRSRAKTGTPTAPSLAARSARTLSWRVGSAAGRGGGTRCCARCRRTKSGRSGTVSDPACDCDQPCFQLPVLRSEFAGTPRIPSTYLEQLVVREVVAEEMHVGAR